MCLAFEATSSQSTAICDDALQGFLRLAASQCHRVQEPEEEGPRRRLLMDLWQNQLNAGRLPSTGKGS